MKLKEKTLEIKLSDLSEGMLCHVVKIPTVAPLGLQLQEMGLLPGTNIEIIRKAPLGGPIEIKVRGTHFSLRLNDARVITVALP